MVVSDMWHILFSAENRGVRTPPWYAAPQGITNFRAYLMYWMAFVQSTALPPVHH